MKEWYTQLEDLLDNMIEGPPSETDYGGDAYAQNLFLPHHYDRLLGYWVYAWEEWDGIEYVKAGEYYVLYTPFPRLKEVYYSIGAADYDLTEYEWILGPLKVLEDLLSNTGSEVEHIHSYIHRLSVLEVNLRSLLIRGGSDRERILPLPMVIVGREPGSELGFVHIPMITSGLSLSACIQMHDYKPEEQDVRALLGFENHYDEVKQLPEGSRVRLQGDLIVENVSVPSGLGSQGLAELEWLSRAIPLSLLVGYSYFETELPRVLGIYAPYSLGAFEDLLFTILHSARVALAKAMDAVNWRVLKGCGPPHQESARRDRQELGTDDLLEEFELHMHNRIQRPDQEHPIVERIVMITLGHRDSPLVWDRIIRETLGSFQLSAKGALYDEDLLLSRIHVGELSRPITGGLRVEWIPYEELIDHARRKGLMGVVSRICSGRCDENVLELYKWTIRFACTEIFGSTGACDNVLLGEKRAVTVYSRLGRTYSVVVDYTELFRAFALLITEYVHNIAKHCIARPRNLTNAKLKLGNHTITALGGELVTLTYTGLGLQRNRLTRTVEQLANTSIHWACKHAYISNLLSVRRREHIISFPNGGTLISSHEEHGTTRIPIPPGISIRISLLNGLGTIADQFLKRYIENYFDLYDY
ncbi:MAG: hypothetical protein F7C35_03580 [Desulfurococcales archaeon]|nr:hypothetical protein [Desulfurococcales archaeon]